jgi:hypothetical protein
MNSPRRQHSPHPNAILLTSFDDFKVKDARYMNALLFISSLQLVIMMLIFVQLIGKWKVDGLLCPS